LQEREGRREGGRMHGQGRGGGVREGLHVYIIKALDLQLLGILSVSSACKSVSHNGVS